MSQKSVWIQTFGAKIHQGNTAISNGYSANTQGLLVGFDREVEDDLILGTSLSYVDSSIESIGKQKLTNLDSYQLNIYGAKDFSQYFVNTMLGFAYNKYSSLRKIPIFDVEAKAKYSGQTYVSRIEAGGNFRMKNNYIITPLLAITMAKNVVQNYQETGAPDLNYRVRNNSTSFFETRLGINVSKMLQPTRMQKIQPNFGISYGYDFAGSKQKTRATFVGQDAGFDAKSANIPQGSLRFEVGTKIFHMNSFSFDAIYAFDLRNNYHAHSGSVRAKYDF
jgi:outer membrane autotransporter protein